MSHTPFIIGSYAIAAVLLMACALGPVIKFRKLMSDLTRRYSTEVKDHAP